MERQPLIIVVICFIMGLVLAPLNDTRFLAAALLGLLILLYLIFRRSDVTVSQVMIMLGFITAGVVWGWAGLSSGSIIANFEGQTVDMSGKVIRSAAYANRQEIWLQIDLIEAAEKQMHIEEKSIAVLYDESLLVLPGDLVKLRGEVRLPASGGNVGEFDYSVYLQRKGIFTRVIAGEIALLRRGTPSFNRYVTIIRNETIAKFFTALPENQAAVISGILFGDTSYLDKSNKETYKNLGVMHVFAVSGMHVSYITALLLLFTTKLKLKSWVKVVLIALGLFGYSALAGFSASVVRATIMTVVGLTAYLVGRRKNFYNALALAAFFWLLLNPADVFAAGFQMSFAAALSIYYLYPLGDKLLFFITRGKDIFIVPLIAQLGLLPLLIYHFGLFSPWSILANIPVVLVVGIIVLSGFIVLLIQSILWPAAEMLLLSMGMLVELTNAFLTLLARLPAAALFVRLPRLWEIILYYVVLVILREKAAGNLKLSLKNKRRIAFFTVMLFAVAVFASFVPNPGQLKVVFLDVGQGDAALIMAPNGKNILVDAAGGGYNGFDVGRDKLVPALHRLGIRKIDLFINSHPDRDHLDGIFAVAEVIPVKEAVLPRLSGRDNLEYQQFLGLLKQRNISYSHLSQGDVIKISPAISMEVLSPPVLIPDDWEVNDQSLVILLQYKEERVIFTGDIQQKAIGYLTAGESDIEADLIKVPHHGSAGSFTAEFYEEVDPDFAVISVGRNNSFGHPSPVVMKYFQQEGIESYRTDQNGATVITSDGLELKVMPNKNR